MINKDQVNKVILQWWNERFVELWWDLKLPGLGNASPNEVWEKDPARVLEYVGGYATVD